ncbi:hypothetical protein [Hydrogenophaga sp.]|uniref:hypothetical protein n=1 Tax=Hydrogenophaga sp. TaxID=1904254 RepID=UPI002ABA3906|nr:hypothetical protein [Hydrogenophaga sp.]MDZ4397041.1 hypothetical protein [Hydrogenophaga sp.]
MGKQQNGRFRIKRRARRRNIMRQREGAQKTISIHRMAIDLLKQDVLAGKVALGRFHGGVEWRALQPLFAEGLPVTVRAEEPLKVGGRRYIPDLVVRCRATGRIVLAIEVWHSHSVSASKRRAYQVGSIPWIEVRAWGVICRRLGQALPILDWGGIVAVDSPCQQDLFLSVPMPVKVPERSTAVFGVRSRHWQLPKQSHALLLQKFR